MAFDLESITTGYGPRPPRVILTGTEKIGKSTWASLWPGSIFIPITGEEGIDDIQVPQWPPCQSLNDVFACLSELYHKDHSFLNVVIDSGSTLEPVLHKATCVRVGHSAGIESLGGGYGKGYTEALTEWRQLMAYLDALRNTKGMSCIIIGHVKLKRFDDPTGPSYDRYQLDLNDRAASSLFRWADSILFCSNKVTVEKEDGSFNREVGKASDMTGGQRYLFTQSRPAHPGGGRGVYGRLPYELPLSYDHFAAAVQSASAAPTTS